MPPSPPAAWSPSVRTGLFQCSDVLCVHVPLPDRWPCAPWRGSSLSSRPASHVPPPMRLLVRKPWESAAAGATALGGVPTKSETTAGFSATLLALLEGGREVLCLGELMVLQVFFFWLFDSGAAPWQSLEMTGCRHAASFVYFGVLFVSCRVFTAFFAERPHTTSSSNGSNNNSTAATKTSNGADNVPRGGVLLHGSRVPIAILSGARYSTHPGSREQPRGEDGSWAEESRRW